MTGYSLDISGLNIVNEKHRTSNREYASGQRAHAAASPRSDRKQMGFAFVAVLMALVIAIGAGIFHSSVVTNYRLMESGAPQSIMEFVEKYPEASSFALDWEKYHNKSRGISIDSEVKKGRYPLFIQWDKRWGYRTYGNGQFLGITGCGPTCLSMVYSGITGKADMNPYKMGCFSEENGYYVNGTGTSWSLMTDGAAGLGLKSKQLKSQKALLKALSNGHPVIASVGAGDFTNAGHFILMTGLSDDGRDI